MMSGRRVWCGPRIDELVDRQPLVALRVRPVDQADEVAPGLAALLVLHRHTGHQQAVKSLVGRQQRGDAEVQHLLERVVAGGSGNVGVEPEDRFAQAKRQQHLPIAGPLGRRAVVGDVRAVAVGVAHVLQPGQGLLLELVFGQYPLPELLCGLLLVRRRNGPDSLERQLGTNVLV